MLSIGDLSRRAGVKVPTIRYYEQAGLIAPAGRTDGNQRRYAPSDLERLSFIRHARDLGLPIAAIRELIDLGEHPDMPCAEAHAIAGAHLGHIRARIERLEKLERELKRIVALKDHDCVGDCAVLKALADHDQCASEHEAAGA